MSLVKITVDAKSENELVLALSFSSSVGVIFSLNVFILIYNTGERKQLKLKWTSN